MWNCLNELKSAIKNGTEVTLNLKSNLIGSSNDETNFLRRIKLTDSNVSKIREAFGNVSSANIKFSKTHLSKAVQLKEFLFGSPNTFGLPLTPIQEITSLTNSCKI